VSGGLAIALDCLAAALLIGAAAQDVAARVVGNGLSLALAGVGLALQALAGQALGALGAGAAVFAAAALCWRGGWLGGGDVKLLGAAALLVPPRLVPDLLLAVALAGGGLATVYLLLGRVLPKPAAGRPAKRLARILRVEQRRIRRHFSLPYASAIAAGALFTFLIR